MSSARTQIEPESDDEIFARLCSAIDRVVLMAHRAHVLRGLKKAEAGRLVAELKAATLNAQVLEGRAVD